MPISMERITVLVLSGSSLEVVIAYQMENHYDKACMNYGLKCALQYTLYTAINFQISGPDWIQQPTTY